MNCPRDVVEEITAIRDRRRFGHSMAELMNRLMELELAFKRFDRSQRELAKYFPVALVASIEGFFRLAIRDLVDSDGPYLSNARPVASGIRLDYSLMQAVHGRQITIGELIAHGIQISRIEHIDSVLSKILDKKYLSLLRETTDRWANEVMGEPERPMLEDPDAVFEHVARTFELRHIICHEIASAFKVDLDEIEVCFKSCIAFLKTSNHCISEVLYPGAPLTQGAMNVVASESLEKSERYLAQSIEEYAKKHPERAEALRSINADWERFCKTWVHFRVGDGVGGGTIWPVLYCGARESLVTRWREEIESHAQSSESEA